MLNLTLEQSFNSAHRSATQELNELKKKLSDLKKTKKAKLNYGDVGSAIHVAELLQEINQFLG